MSRRVLGLAVAAVLACWPAPAAFGQGMGSAFGGMNPGAGFYDDASARDPAKVPDVPLLDRTTAESFIAIDGRAEIRVRPTEVRVVMAVTAEAETAQQCQTIVDASVARLKAAWEKAGVAPEKIVIDFVTMLPHYEWNYEKRGGLSAVVEKKVGYRTQSNAHVAVPGDAQAKAVLAAAFAEGINDVLAFDYWSGELDAVKVKARAEAMKSARGKAGALLGGLVKPFPEVINVQERTTVRYPSALYHTVTNQHDNSDDRSWDAKLRRADGEVVISAYRPLNSYYRGLSIDSDVQPAAPPMNPEISVVSTVRLYFQSPAANRAKPAEAAPKTP